MDKLGVIGADIAAGAKATFAFWKHVFQLLVEIFSFGYLQFEMERETIKEENLKDINGRYLKFKAKGAVVASAASSNVELTPLGETLLAQDSLDGFEDALEQSPAFRAQLT